MISSALIVKKFNKNHELKHRTIKKTGTQEQWNNGILGKAKGTEGRRMGSGLYFCPSFQHSNIPNLLY
jgi:hypothetical protein